MFVIMLKKTQHRLLVGAEMQTLLCGARVWHFVHAAIHTNLCSKRFSGAVTMSCYFCLCFWETTVIIAMATRSRLSGNISQMIWWLTSQQVFNLSQDNCGLIKMRSYFCSFSHHSSNNDIVLPKLIAETPEQEKSDGTTRAVRLL